MSLISGTSIHASQIGLGKGLLLLLPLLLLGCRDQVSQEFKIQGTTDGGRGVARNQPVVLRFSQPLSERLIPTRALSIRDAAGRQLKTDISIDGRHLIIRPRGNDRDGGWPRWPRTASLTIDLPVPVAGPGFQSASGQFLKEGVQLEVPVHAESARLPGFLRLVASQPADGTRNIAMGATANRKDEKWFDIKLRFNAPLDPATVETGIQVIDEERKLSIASAKLSPIDHGLAVIQLFVGGLQRFNADTTYQVILNRDLRSRDGRPLAAEQRISFHTAKEGTRLLQINFDERSDFDNSSQFAWDAATRNLRLRTRDDIVVTLGDGKTQQAGLDVVLRDAFPGKGDAYDFPHVFSKKPSRSQFLIPGEWIGKEPRLITGITFLTKGPVLQGTHAADLVVVIGTLNPAKDPAEGLGDEFAQNCIDGQVMTLEGGTNGYDFYATLSKEERDAQPTPGTSNGEHPSVANLNFSAPYLYPGGETPLVVEIKNQSGVSSPNESLDANGGPGVIVCGAPSQQSLPPPPNSLALGERNASATYFPASPFVLRLGLKTKVFPPAISRWYVVDDVDSPKFQSTLSNDDIGGGRNLQLHRDFLVEFQSGIPMLDNQGNPVRWPNGSPRCTPSGPSNAWSPYPPDDGHPAIRVRVRFIPRWYTPGEEPPEIEYILMHYEDRS